MFPIKNFPPPIEDNIISFLEWREITIASEVSKGWQKTVKQSRAIMILIEKNFIYVLVSKQKINRQTLLTGRVFQRKNYSKVDFCDTFRISQTRSDPLFNPLDIGMGMLKRAYKQSVVEELETDPTKKSVYCSKSCLKSCTCFNLHTMNGRLEQEPEVCFF